MIQIFLICSLGIRLLPEIVNSVNDDAVSQQMKVDGKYGLYIKESGGSWEINWLTSKQENGIFKVIKNGEVLKEGETQNSTIHKAFVSEIDGPFLLEFGGRISGTSQIIIDSNFEPHPSVVKNVDSVYVLGDVHGEFEVVRQILQNSGIVDGNLHWTGNGAHLVFDGDVMDRGDDVIRVLWFIYELEKEAKIAGGAVHFVLGNHEIMVMSNDLRYVSRKEKQRASMYQVAYRDFVDPHETILGRWIASKPSIFKIDNILFSHGGVITNYGDFSAKTFNDSVAMFMQEPVFTHLMDEEIDSTVLSKDRWLYLQDFFNDPYNPYWFRGYARSDTLSSYLDLIHEKFGTKIHVIGHTPFPTITERYNGKLIATNVEKFGTEMLLLVRKGKRNYRRYRIDIEGNIEGL